MRQPVALEKIFIDNYSLYNLAQSTKNCEIAPGYFRCPNVGFKIYSSTNEERSSERESDEGPTITSNSPGSTTYWSSEL